MKESLIYLFIYLFVCLSVGVADTRGDLGCTAPEAAPMGWRGHHRNPRDPAPLPALCSPAPAHIWPPASLPPRSHWLPRALGACP